MGAPPSPLQLIDAGLWKTKAYVNGEWRSGKTTFAVTNPATGEEVGSVPDLAVEETHEAIDHAHAAFLQYKQKTPAERSTLLRKLFDLISQATPDLAELISVENGKVLADAKIEVFYGASFLNWYSGEAIRIYGDVWLPHFGKTYAEEEQVLPAQMVPGQRNLVIKEPIGVCALITPWNFPFAMILRKLAAALAAGCTVVIKPDPLTPFSALAIAELCERAGFPKGIVNVITTKDNNAAIGKALCENPVVRKVSFTGSTRVGKLLASQSASTLTKVSLELGGNAPLIIFDDADLELAMQGAIKTKLSNSGQTCVSANRIYVQSKIYDDFAARLVERAKSAKVGSGFDKDTSIGPLMHAQALEKVERHVEDAKKHGAKVLFGGRRLPGELFYEPTVLTDMSVEALVNHEETFGPVAALFRFETEEEVIKAANDVDVGLAAYVYSRDYGRLFRVAEALRTGMVGVNTAMLMDASIPFGGVHESGLGREGGKHGLEEYLTTKVIALGGILAGP